MNRIFVSLSLFFVGLITVLLYFTSGFIQQTSINTPLTLFGGLLIIVLAAFAGLKDAIELIEKIFAPSEEKVERTALTSYYDLIFRTCDYISLSGLPEDDRHIATKNLTLSDLYIPLRLQVENKEAEDDLENKRYVDKLFAAGKVIEGINDSTKENPRQSISDILKDNIRVVVLGDPGAGKSTLTKWLTMGLLLKIKDGKFPENFIDASAIPKKKWTPIIIRCRELNKEQISSPFDDILEYSIRVNDVRADMVTPLKKALKEKLSNGEAILIIDGLDEIVIDDRSRFCDLLQKFSLIHHQTPILVTSRIVGYREIKNRLGSNFLHCMIADLETSEKREFARRWIGITEPEEAQKDSTSSLIEAIESSESIRRLTGNPMQLTTLALVKRKLGKLPHRRAELYFHCMEVLLNWRSQVDKIIEPREAYPQLEYIAYEMTKREIAQINQEEILSLLEDVRIKIKNRAIQRHDPEHFLKTLESRTSILIESGFVKENGKELPVYEFRHLTFQEYLAGIALITGSYSDFKKGQPLSEKISEISSQTKIVTRKINDLEFIEHIVASNWLEVLRLCIASANRMNVDDALLSILNKRETETVAHQRARTVTAALCLADEPSVSDETAIQVIESLVEEIREYDGYNNNINTSIDEACIAIGNCEWEELLLDTLMGEFINSENFEKSLKTGSMFMGISHRLPKYNNLINNSDVLLKSNEDSDVIKICLVLAQKAFSNELEFNKDLLDQLVKLIDKTPAVQNAAVWAIKWIIYLQDGQNRSKIVGSVKSKLISVLQQQHSRTHTIAIILSIFRALNEEIDPYSFIYSCAITADTGDRSKILNPSVREYDKSVIPELLKWLDNDEQRIRHNACLALLGAGYYDDRCLSILLEDVLYDGFVYQNDIKLALYYIFQYRAKAALPSLINSFASLSTLMADNSMLVTIGLVDETDAPVLIESLKDNNAKVREYVALILGTLNDPQILDSLSELLKSETNPDVIRETERAIKRIRERLESDKIVDSKVE